MAIPSQFRFVIGTEASLQYKLNNENISNIKYRIDKNRIGELDLTKITASESRLNKRIQRELVSGIPIEIALERINGVSNFQDTVVLKKLERLSKTICRIVLADGYGTGFLIGNNLLITNNHVIPDQDTASSAYAEFNYELDEYNQIAPIQKFKLLPEIFFMTSEFRKNQQDPFSGLDFSIVALEPVNKEGISLSGYGFTSLDKGLGKIIEGENCVVIQHPEGKVKKVVLKDIRMLTLNENTLVYESDTLPGSSGSMVIGLGTGEVVALHHSGIPRTDEHGNWLRKDGSQASPNDPDELIDWIGNEGIRVSRLIQAVQKMSLPDEMEVVRKNLIRLHEQIILGGKKITTGDLNNHTMTQKNENDATATKQIVYLEVLLTEDKRYVSDWHMRTGELVEGLIKSDALFPSSTDPILSRFYYLTVSTHKSPWELAHTIEQLPHVDSCTPDIELATDIGLEEHKVKTTEQTVQFEGLFGKRSAEEKFLAKWGSSDWVKKAHAIDKLFHRQWHWVAVNHPEIKSPASLNPLKESLQQLRFVQLDTGYTVHPKIFSSYNLDQDLDFLDDDENALDMMADAFLQHPAHGTRTASIALGSKHQEIIEDGNIGILTDGNANPLTKLIPYRIAKSVILINRGKQLVDAASHAIRNGTDVMFMCMGSIPRDMFDAVAREAYEQGVIWVCAAGNQVRFVIAPACYPGTIAVAAINPDDKAWSGSCRGDMVDISAPGEDCYVPGWDDDNRYCMSYGSGTSYATPQVASAAMLWKAKNLDKLSTAYQYKWQIVEAFRHCIKSTARSNNKLPAGKFGAGVLDIEKLLAAKLPAAGTLHHAYSEKGLPPVHPIGEREMAHTIWNSDTIAAERKAGESMTRVAWSNRAKEAYNALVKQSTVNATESMTTEKPKDNFSLLESYFKPY